MTVGEFAEAVASLAFIVPFSETSGGRSVKRNFAVGGQPLSAHLLFLGRDIVLDDPKDKTRLLLLAKKRGLAAVDEKDHIHLEPADY
jgi:hypothetical protein